MAYLYSVYGYRMKEEFGEIHVPEYWTREAIFYPDNHHVPKTRYITAQQEGMVYNHNVWFEKQNRSKAAKLLIQSEQDKIDSLNSKIKKHEALIEVLKEI